MNKYPDTIHSPDIFSKRLPCSFDGIFDWSWTKGCFGETKITPTDLDGIVERNGHFLIFETKEPGAEIPEGQLILLHQLMKMGKFTVFIIWGKSLPEEFQVWYPNGKIKDYRGVEKAKERVRAWFNFINRVKYETHMDQALR